MEKRRNLYRKLKTQGSLLPKWQLIPLFSVLLLWMSLPVLANEDNNQIEKKKNITYAYSVDANDKVSLDNQFGDIQVQIWDKNEFKVDITITANAYTESKALDYINSVVINANKSDDQISVKTNMGKNNLGNNWNINNSDEKINLRVDYHVYMPKANALRVKNSFGNITLPNFSAALTIDENYGNFTAGNLNNAQNDIDVKFGKAFINSMKTGNLNLSYSNLQLEKADDLYLINKFGKLDIKEVGSLDGKISYSSGLIGLVTESAKIKIEFSGGLKIGSVAKTVNHIDVNAAYSAITLPLEEGGNYDFDVKVSYGDFKFPNNTTFSKNSSEEDKNGPKFRSTKYYTGKIGKGGGKIIINSSFGPVKIQ